MAVSRTEMLEHMDLVAPDITFVLYGWVKNEGNNLQGFIDNPSGHVNYNPYVIMDFTKLQQRLAMLRTVEECLNVITEYKRGNLDYTRSMYESAVDGTHVQLVERLLDWLKKRYQDMTQFIASSGNAQGTAQIDDYAGMFTFNAQKFMAEYTMYKKAIVGCEVVVQYKNEQVVVNPVQTDLLTTNEPPVADTF
jgi:hypothetical protein